MWSPTYLPKDKPCLLPWVRVSVRVANSNLHGTCYGELPFIPRAFLLLFTFLGLAHLLKYDLLGLWASALNQVHHPPPPPSPKTTLTYVKGLCRIISPTNPLLVFIPPPSRPKGSDISFNCSISLRLSEIHRCVSNICNVKRGMLDVINSYNNSLYQFFFLIINFLINKIAYT